MVPGHGRLRLDSRSSFFLDIGKARSDRKQPRRVTSTSIGVMDSVAVGLHSGVAMGWAGSRGPQVPGKKLIFPGYSENWGSVWISNAGMFRLCFVASCARG